MPSFDRWRCLLAEGDGFLGSRIGGSNRKPPAIRQPNYQHGAVNAFGKKTAYRNLRDTINVLIKPPNCFWQVEGGQRFLFIATAAELAHFHRTRWKLTQWLRLRGHLRPICAFSLLPLGS